MSVIKKNQKPTRARMSWLLIVLITIVYLVFLAWYWMVGERLALQKTADEQIQDALFTTMFDGAEPASDNIQNTLEQVGKDEMPPWDWVLLQIWKGYHVDSIVEYGAKVDVSALVWLEKQTVGDPNFWQGVPLEDFRSQLLAVYTWHYHARSSANDTDQLPLEKYKQAGILAHDNQWLEPAEFLFQTVFDFTGDPEALAWLASVETQKALQADSVLKKVGHVENGMQQMDATVEHYPRNITVRMIRIQNYFSLPQMFGSTDKAVTDLLKVIQAAQGSWNYVKTNEKFEQVPAAIPYDSIEQAIALLQGRNDVSETMKESISREWLVMKND